MPIPPSLVRAKTASNVLVRQYLGTQSHEYPPQITPFNSGIDLSDINLNVDVIKIDPVLHDIIAKSNAVRDIQTQQTPRAMTAIVYEATVNHLIETKYRLSVMVACKTYVMARRELISTYMNKLDQDGTGRDPTTLQSELTMVQTVYKNELQILRHSIKAYEEAIRDSLKRRYNQDASSPLFALEKSDMEKYLIDTRENFSQEFPDIVPDSINGYDTRTIRTHLCEFEFLIEHCRLACAFIVSKQKSREDCDLERRHRLIVMKNPPSELGHYFPQLCTEVNEIHHEYLSVQAELTLNIKEEAAIQAEKLILAMCCIRGTQVMLAPTLHGSHVHSELWLKFHRTERQVLKEIRLPQTLHYWRGITQAHGTLDEYDFSDAFSTIIASAVANETRIIHLQHQQQTRALEEAHRVELEALRHERREQQTRHVLRKWKQCLQPTSSPPPMLELEDDFGPIDSEDEIELNHNHRAEILAVVQVTRLIARRRANSKKQHAMREMKVLESLQSHHRTMLAALESELDTVESLEHIRLMERVKKRRAMRTIHGTKKEETNQMEMEERMKIIEECKATFKEAEAAATKRVHEVTLDAIASEVVASGMQESTLKDISIPKGRQFTDTFEALVERLVHVDISHTKCTLSQVHAMEKVLMKMRGRVKDTTRSMVTSTKGHMKKRTFH